ncbi:WhiB family transcriptional regulator [Iamia sp.]|uniref:WhiB family transcriptional regulator n=1 Tax=Iamia sp. TaxID=2722710 RepID=UPI002C299163|nr:WhiB family transcriptional regulator [Iamia sp.]HXH57558.1 WhiB family transcriptional regulator [Iamia sp.]
MIALNDLQDAAEDRSWWADARCDDANGSLSALFFSEELQDIAAAKRICALCPVIEDCLGGALARREPWGVWGGQLFRNGRILASKRRRGRPPKVARPEDELPQVAVPEALADVVIRRTA